MYELIFLIVLGLIWLVFASIQDLKKREVANWLNFSLIIFALGFRFFYSLFNQNFNFLYQGLIGLGIFFVIGNLLYYGRLFAGGDAKLMISLGAILPFSESLFVNVKFFVLFLTLFLFIGGFYGIVSSFFISAKNFEKFRKEFIKQFEINKTKIYIIMAFGLILMLFGFKQNVFLFSGAFVFLLPYLYVYAKSVDESCMIQQIKVQKLREGDWLYKDVKIGKKIIKADWTGLSKKDLSLIRSKSKAIWIREGIPFVPVFLISFIISLLFYFFWFGLWNSFW